MPDILYVLSFGFPIRMILHTPITEHLTELGASFDVLCTEGTDSELERIAKRRSLTLHQYPSNPSRLLSEYLPLRRYFLEDLSANPALRARHLRDVSGIDAQKKSPSWHIRSALRRLLFHYNQHIARNLKSHGVVTRLERSLLRCNQATSVLTRIKPQVVVCTYPIDPAEVEILAAARELGITTVVHQLSWDNLTSKGVYPVVPDYFLSWGPIMTAEIQEIYHTPSDRIFETGVPQFETQQKLANSELAREGLRAMGLSPEVPYLLFGMSSPVFSPDEIDIVEQLAKHVEANRFGPELNLVIRPHPQNVSGYMADPAWLPRLRSLQSSRVGLFWPTMNQSSVRWSLAETDLRDLASIMAACSVNINSGSTFALDGLAHGRPVVLSLFDVKAGRAWHESASRIGEYTHIRKLADSEGVVKVTSFDSLLTAIHNQLQTPPEGPVATGESYRRFCSNGNLGASRAVANALNTILKTLNP